MYPNLKAEMSRYQVTQDKLATLWGVTVSTVSSKMRKGSISMREIVAARNTFFQGQSIEYLLDEHPQPFGKRSA